MIYICLPNLPPSSNNAYLTINRKRVLTKEGRRYKNETRGFIAKHYRKELLFFERNQPYVVLIEFVFHGRDQLMAKTWPDKVEDRYKKVDATNRSKIVEDVLAEATGVDDRHNFIVTVAKRWHRDYERTNIWVWNPEKEGNPIDELLQHLRSAESYGALPTL